MLRICRSRYWQLRRARSAAGWRLATIGALAVAAAAISPAASADTTLPAYNVTQPVGVPNAYGVAVDPGSHRVYVAGAPSQSVAVLDGLTGSVIASIAVPYTPTSLAIDPAAHRLFILGGVRSASKDVNSMSIVDTTTNAIISTVPGPAFLISAGAFAVDTFNHRVLALPMVFDEQGRVITPAGPSSTLGALAIDSSAQRLYITNPSAGTVAVYNSTTLRSVAAVKVSASPTAIAIDTTTHSVYVSDLNNALVSVIDGTTDKVTATIPVGGTPSAVAVASAVGLVYVSNVVNVSYESGPLPAGTVTVIDAAHNTVVGSATVSGAGGDSSRIAVDQITHAVWLAADQLSQLDPVVSRRSGVDRFGTATAISAAAYNTQGADAAVLARSDTYPDALVGAPFAASKNAPLLYTSGATLPTSTAAENTRVLSPGKTVYLLGGTTAIPASIATQLTQMGYLVSRISGSDRYATAVAVADAMGDPSEVFLATAANYADALAAGPAATADPSASAISGADRYATAALVAQQFFAAPTTVGLASGTTFADALPAAAYLARAGGPLLLTDPNALPSTASTYLAAVQSGITKALVFGGASAVSTAAQTEFGVALGR